MKRSTAVWWTGLYSILSFQTMLSANTYVVLCNLLEISTLTQLLYLCTALKSSHCLLIYTSATRYAKKQKSCFLHHYICMKVSVTVTLQITFVRTCKSYDYFMNYDHHHLDHSPFTLNIKMLLRHE